MQPEMLGFQACMHGRKRNRSMHTAYKCARLTYNRPRDDDDLMGSIVGMCIHRYTRRSDLAGGDVARLRLFAKFPLRVDCQHWHSATLHHAGQRCSLLPLPTPAHEVPKPRSEVVCRPVTEKHATSERCQRGFAVTCTPDSERIGSNMHVNAAGFVWGARKFTHLTSLPT